MEKNSCERSEPKILRVLYINGIKPSKSFKKHGGERSEPKKILNNNVKNRGKCKTLFEMLGEN